MPFDEKFLALGEQLPPLAAPNPTALHRPWRRSGNLLFLSGHGPRWGDTFLYTGKIGRDLKVEDGKAAARLTALNLLQTTRQALGTLNDVTQFVDVFGAVNSAPGFTEQPSIVNGFSDCILEIFGEAGRHTRMAIGVPDLPYNIAVEIRMVVEVST
jgi:enamine deaminase RidA (YjgF/YER057c/UK114 family)